MSSYRIETSLTAKDESSQVIDESNRMILNNAIEEDLEKIKSWVKEHLEDEFVSEYGVRIYDADNDEIVFRF